MKWKVVERFLAKSVRLWHLCLNIGVISTMLFVKQSVLYRMLFKDIEDHLFEGVVYLLFFTTSLVLYVYSSFMDPGYLNAKIAEKFTRQHDIEFGSVCEDEPDYDVSGATTQGYATPAHSSRELDMANKSPRLTHRQAMIDPGDIDQYSLNAEDECDDAASALLGRSIASDRGSILEGDLSTPPASAVNTSKFNHNGGCHLLHSRQSLASSGQGGWARLEDNDADLGEFADRVTFKAQSQRLKLPHTSSVGAGKRGKFAPFSNEDEKQQICEETGETSIGDECRKKKKKTGCLPSKKSSYHARPRLELPIRKCKHCLLEQPLRCRHCPECEKCVIKFDHHCPWLANCIGERNHAVFFTFLLFQCVVIWWTFRYTLQSFVHGLEWYSWIKANGFFMANFIILILGGIPATGLFFFHMYLLITGTTTWETVSRGRISYLRGLPLDVQPFDKGCWWNCFAFCFRPFPISWDWVYFHRIEAWQKSEQKTSKRRNHLDTTSRDHIVVNEVVNGPEMPSDHHKTPTPRVKSPPSNLPIDSGVVTPNRHSKTFPMPASNNSPLTINNHHTSTMQSPKCHLPDRGDVVTPVPSVTGKNTQHNKMVDPNKSRA